MTSENVTPKRRRSHHHSGLAAFAPRRNDGGEMFEN